MTFFSLGTDSEGIKCVIYLYENQSSRNVADITEFMIKEVVMGSRCKRFMIHKANPDQTSGYIWLEKKGEHLPKIFC